LFRQSLPAISGATQVLRVRAEQVAVFEQAAVRDFEDRMVAHLRKFAPSHFKFLTEAEVRQVICHGMKRAERHGFASRRSLRIYIELMLMLGSGFDADPQLPWAAELLNDERIIDETERIDCLRDKAWEYFNQLLPDFGNSVGDVRRKEFLKQIRQLRQEGDAVLPEYASPQFQGRAIALLNQGLPEKCELLGEKSLRELIERGIHWARSYDITSAGGALLFIAVMFVLGSSFDKDPQLPWAARILKDRSITSRHERQDRFFAAAIEALERWLRLAHDS
jgi:hypothetical protein